MKNLKNVKYRCFDNLALITIDRAEKHNAISLQTLEELNQAVDFAATDSAIGVIAITGAGGKAFEPPLVCRRLITSCHATISNVFNCA